MKERQGRALSPRVISQEANGTIDLEGECQHARAVAVLTAPHEGRAAAHLCGALNSLKKRYNRAARAGRDRCIPHCVYNNIQQLLTPRSVDCTARRASPPASQTRRGRAGWTLPICALPHPLDHLLPPAFRRRHLEPSQGSATMDQDAVWRLTELTMRAHCPRYPQQLNRLGSPR
jgi:hypothetical protein